MQKVQVYVIESKSVEARVEGAKRAFEAIVAQSELCRNEHFGAIDAAVPENFTDVVLVEIGSGGVDEAIPGRDRNFERADDNRAFDVPLGMPSRTPICSWSCPSSSCSTNTDR